ncbi:MAG TPA: hypothetical protein VGI73_10750 [Solirubrobacterales bacterium]|jgi:hypothetical protein
MAELSAPAELSLAEVNAVMAAFGAEHRRAVASEGRANMTSSLFDVPRRSSLAAAIFYEQGPAMLRLLLRYTTPERLGAAMKRPGSRPYGLSLWVVLGSYLTGRQQVHLDSGVAPGEPVADRRPEDLRTVVEFFVRVSRAYRDDDELFPTPAVPTQPILAEEVLAQVLAVAEAPTPERLATVHRTGANLTLHSFLVHGEQRDGLFGHGPYPGPEGSVVWFEEFNDLRNAVLPWAQLECEPLPVDNVVNLYAADGVTVEANMFGAVRVDPLDYEGSLRLLGSFTYADGAPRRLGDEELAAIAALAEQRYARIFEQAVEWSDDYRIAYGAPLFANHLIPFFELAGVPDGAGFVLDRFERGTAAALAALRSDPEPPSFWSHLASDASRPLYSPAL